VIGFVLRFVVPLNKQSVNYLEDGAQFVENR
jgi:hypothetical protein